MSTAKSQRKKIFVNRRIQGSVLLRFFGYWLVYHFVLWHSLFLFYFMHSRVQMLNGDGMQPFGQIYVEFCAQYYPMLLAALAVLPMLLYDSVRTTHRIAGPLIRFRNTLQKLRNGERVEQVQLRKGDLLIDFQNEFNDFLKFYNTREDDRRRTRTESEEMLFQEVHSLREQIAKAARGTQYDVSSEEASNANDPDPAPSWQSDP